MASAVCVEQVSVRPFRTSFCVFKLAFSNMFLFFFCMTFANRLPPAGHKIACGTACHTAHEAQFCSTAISQKAYSMARSGSLKLPGFPRFETVVQELSSAKDLVNPDYEVCAPLANGCLAIRESLVEYWSKEENLFAAELLEVIKEHNRKYNPKGIKRGSTTNTGGSGNDSADCQRAKRAKVQAPIKSLDHETHLTDKCLGLNLLETTLFICFVVVVVGGGGGGGGCLLLLLLLLLLLFVFSWTF